MNIFLGLIGVHEFFSFNFPLREYFFCTSPHQITFIITIIIIIIINDPSFTSLRENGFRNIVSAVSSRRIFQRIFFFFGGGGIVLSQMY